MGSRCGPDIECYEKLLCGHTSYMFYFDDLFNQFIIVVFPKVGLIKLSSIAIYIRCLAWSHDEIQCL